MTELSLTIITPCLNAAKTIEQTIGSVISQEGDFPVQYIIVDGGSTDGTREIVSEWAKQVNGAGSTAYRNRNMITIFEKDEGMYEALAKGFRLATGDIIAYLNADDFYLPGAFLKVHKAFSEHPDVSWLTGIICIFNAVGEITRTFTPFDYRREYIRKGFYNGKMLPFIQQESTFWKRELQDKVDPDGIAKFKYAGDHFLWYTFASYSQLYHLHELLAGFRINPGQKSSNMDKYLEEFKTISSYRITFPGNLKYLLHKIMWYLPGPVKRWLNNHVIHP
jgi:glycosyltransferase involved in cell wall biosynthesis